MTRFFSPGTRKIQSRLLTLQPSKICAMDTACMYRFDESTSFFFVALAHQYFLTARPRLLRNLYTMLLSTAPSLPLAVRRFACRRAVATAQRSARREAVAVVGDGGSSTWNSTRANNARSRSFSTTTSPGKKIGTKSNDSVVVVSGVRLPFATVSTIYEDQMAVDLQRLAIQGLLTQTALPKNEVDYVVCGNVIQEVRTSNIAREASINAGYVCHQSPAKT